MQLGAELGLGPMTAIQNIAVINGRPTVWGDVMLGLCMSSGLFDEEAFFEEMTGNTDSDDWEASCDCRRLGKSKLVTQTFSVRDAKRAGLWDKKGPWQQYPERMLQMRARSWALRDAFPDVLKGVYSAEEARDIVVDAVPSEDHLAQAQMARGAEMAAEVVAEKAQAREAREAEEAAEEHGYNENIDAATLVTELIGLQIQVTSHPSLTEEAKDRLIAKIEGRLAEPTVKGKHVPAAADPGKVADVQTVEPENALTSDGEEAGYGLAIVDANQISGLVTFQGQIDACGILTTEAKNRLTTAINWRKVVIRASRGPRSNEVEKD